MPKVDVRNLKNEVVGKLELSDEVFAGPINEGLMHDAVKQYLASQRSGTHKTKTRAEVAGSGRKPWKQKGTGRARVGEVRTPLWRDTNRGVLMTRTYDALVVGARCAGAPTAMLLARQGHSVLCPFLLLIS